MVKFLVFDLNREKKNTDVEEKFKVLYVDNTVTGKKQSSYALEFDFSESVMVPMNVNLSAVRFKIKQLPLLINYSVKGAKVEVVYDLAVLIFDYNPQTNLFVNTQVYRI